jgi:WD40 repeat protein
MVAFENTNILKLIFSSYVLYDLAAIQTKIKNKHIYSITVNSLGFNNILQSLFIKIHITINVENLQHLQLLPNNNVVSISDDNIIKFWELNTYTCINTIKTIKQKPTRVCFLPNDNIACGYDDGTIELLDAKENYHCTASKRVHPDPITCLILLGNGKLASGMSNVPNQRYYNLIIWDIENGLKDIKTIIRHCGSMKYLVNISERYFASAAEDCSVKIWDVQDNYNCVWKLFIINYYNDVSLICLFSESFNRFVDMDIFQAWEGCLKIMEKCDEVKTDLGSLLYLSHGYFASCDDGVIKIWNLKTLQCIKKLDDVNASFMSNSFILKDYRIVSQLDDEIHIWTY